MQADDPMKVLRQLGEAGDGPHDIARAALMLAALDHPGKSLVPYTAHLEELAAGAAREGTFAGRPEDAVVRLVGLLSGRFGYAGDRLSYDDPKNADLIGVIDRRRGLPVALGVLYIHAARAAGLSACGLSAPGHFLLRISVAGREAIVDPFNGNVLDRVRLGASPVVRAAAIEEQNVLEPVSDTDVLLRLQNNLKLRASEAGDSARAIEIARRMATIAPKAAELWLELARLNDSAGVLRAAREAYENCLAIASPGEAWHNEAALALASLKRRLN
jgi:regulator of sirC expression with transglutaminase-like and TPR domain